MIIENRTIKAEKGKCLFRKSDGFFAGLEIALGYTYYIGGKKLEEPILEMPQDYEEVEVTQEIIDEYGELWAASE